MCQLESSLEPARQVSENASARKVLDIYQPSGSSLTCLHNQMPSGKTASEKFIITRVKIIDRVIDLLSNGV
jgi:hypothetical protein